MCISIRDAQPATVKFINDQLLLDLRQSLPQSINNAFDLVAYTHDENVAGGLTASTAYGWLLIKSIWVDEVSRGLGIGKALMREAESRGQQGGCHGAWLDTSNPQARRFYQSIGYEEFGELSNESLGAPQTHRRWFMKKQL